MPPEGAKPYNPDSATMCTTFSEVCNCSKSQAPHLGNGKITAWSLVLLWELNKRMHVKYPIMLPGKKGSDIFLFPFWVALNGRLSPLPSSFLLPPFPFISLWKEHFGNWYLLPAAVKADEDMPASHYLRSCNPMPQEAIETLISNAVIRDGKTGLVTAETRL